VKLRLPILVLSAAVALSLSACMTGAPDASPAAGSNRPSATASAAAEAPKSENSKFGESYTFSNGVVVTVSAPQPLTPSEFASKGTEPNFLAFDVTVVNGTQENFDPSLFYVTLQSANAEATGVYDAEISIPPQTALLPGREVTWKVGYGVLDTNDLVMEVTPGVEYVGRIFTN
jgi:hypothetical protein